MPLIHRVTMDMFEFADVCSHMVNPVNLVAAPGRGLALEFRKRVPQFYEPYREACLKTKELRIGTIQIFDDTDQPWSIINFPTKRHYADDSDKDDITRGLEALRDMLLQEKYKNSVVGMPMLGCGLGKQDYEVMYPIMVQYLDGLDATVFLSMSPERTEMRPRYLTIAGPLTYGTTEEEQKNINWVIDKAMEKWGTKLEDYTGIVSGGYPGVDTYIAGSEFGKDEENTFVFKRTGKRPLVCKPNTHRDGVGANLHLGNLLCEIGDDVILFKPVGHNNNRLSAMQVRLQADKEEKQRNGMYPKNVAIFGEIDKPPKKESILIPEEADIPY